MKLSIIIPVFNEQKTIVAVLEKIQQLQLPKSIEKEVIVVDDGSKDNTASLVETFVLANKKDKIHFYKHKKNVGKGAAVRTGIEHATGEYIVIQDADLEYNPEDIRTLLDVVLQKKADVVYGTRLKRLPHFSKEEKTGQFLLHYAGNKFLSLMTSALYGQWITDMETCYKMFPKKAADNIKLFAKGFEFEPEITAKLMKRGFHIYEVPIKTKPRSYNEGKKLNTFIDGRKALWTLLKYRFVD